mgnify:CR=1 FL=1
MEKKKDKKRLDILLFEKGLAETRTKAQAFIMGGGVLVNGQLEYKPGALFSQKDEIELKDINPYVSRGGLHILEGRNTNGMPRKQLKSKR